MKTLLDEMPEELPAVMAKLRLDQVAALLEFATSWNTKTKDSREAQVRTGGVLFTQGERLQYQIKSSNFILLYCGAWKELAMAEECLHAAFCESSV